jgi:putative oligomerization/nucleic acid binding protein
MSQRDARQAQEADAAARSYIQSAAGTPTSTADEVTKLASLRDQGVITDAEFAAQKAKVLG